MRTSLLLATPALLIAAACSPNPGAPIFDANTAGNAMAASAEGSAETFDFAPAAGFAPCPGGGDRSYDAGSDPTDPDLDGIPTNVSVTYTDCTFLGITTNGREYIIDGDPNAVRFFWTAGRENLTLTGADGAELYFNDTIVTDDSSGVTLLVDGTHRFTAANGDEIEETVSWADEYIPDTAWSVGSPIVPGQLTIAGSYDFTADGNSFNATLAADLHMDPGCRNGDGGPVAHGIIDSGSATATFTHDGTTYALVVTWTACGQHSVVLNEI